MDKFLKQCIGEGPYPHPLESIKDSFEIFHSEVMAIIQNKKKVCMPEGVHYHSSYEFVMPLYRPIHSVIDKKKTIIENNKLYSINSEQIHGSTEAQPGVQILAVQIDREFMQDISYEVFGKREVDFVNDNYCLDRKMKTMINLFANEFSNQQAGYRFILQGLSTSMAVHLLRSIKNNIFTYVTEGGCYEKENIKRAVDFLKEYYNKDYSLEDVARVANLSPYYFIRVFKANTGKPPYEFLLGIKIDKAKELLKRKGMTITEVCFACGFKSPSHFGSLFKKVTGLTPSEYRKQ